MRLQSYQPLSYTPCTSDAKAQCSLRAMCYIHFWESSAECYTNTHTLHPTPDGGYYENYHNVTNHPLPTPHSLNYHIDSWLLSFQPPTKTTDKNRSTRIAKPSQVKPYFYGGLCLSFYHKHQIISPELKYRTIFCEQNGLDWVQTTFQLAAGCGSPKHLSPFLKIKKHRCHVFFAFEVYRNLKN